MPARLDPMRPHAPSLVALACFVVPSAGCGGSDDALFDSLDAEHHPLGSLQAQVDLGTEGRQPFVADEALALISSNDEGGELVMHATDRDGRRSLSVVIGLAQAEIPGTIDLADHLVVYTEVDAAGRPQLILDDIPFGTLDLTGMVVPGGDIAGTFQFALPEVDSEGTPVVGRFEGAFSALILREGR